MGITVAELVADPLLKTRVIAGHAGTRAAGQLGALVRAGRARGSGSARATS